MTRADDDIPETGSSPGVAGLSDRRLRVGLIGALLMFLAQGVLHVLAVPTTISQDEPNHIAYAIEIAEGHLPDVREPVSLEKLHVDRSSGGARHLAAAAHPPLYYTILAAPLGWASATGEMEVGIRVARLITLLLGAAGLVYAFLSVLLIVPRFPAVAVATTAVAATVPSFVHLSSLVFNDALGFLTTTAMAHAVLLVFVRGPSWRRILLVGVWAGLATSTRFAAIFAVLPAVAAVGVAVLLHTEGSRGRKLARAALACMGVLAFPVLLSGWFYVRSYLLYGDPTAAKTLLVQLHRRTREPFLHHLLSPDRWLTLLDHLWGRLAGKGLALRGTITLGARLLALAAAAGFVAVAFRLRHSLGRAWLKKPEVIGGLFVVSAFLCVLLPVFEFYSRGGSMHARYCFPLIWLPLLVVGIGASSVRSRLPGATLLVTYALLSLAATSLYLTRFLPRNTKLSEVPVASALREVGVPAWGWVTFLALAAFAAGLVLAVSAWQTLHRRIEPEAEQTVEAEATTSR